MLGGDLIDALVSILQIYCVYCFVRVALPDTGTGDKRRQRIAGLNGDPHDATEVFRAVAVHERRVPYLFESQVRRRSARSMVVIADVSVQVDMLGI